MTKRRVVSELMFKRSHGFKVGAKTPIVAVLSGTGTIAAAGILTLSMTATYNGAVVYITVSSGTNIGTAIGTYASTAGAPI